MSFVENNAGEGHRIRAVGESIKKLLFSIKKDGSLRKNSKYISTRKSRIDTLWRDFQKLHYAITCDLTDEHNLTENQSCGGCKYFKQINAYYSEAQQKLDGHKEKLQSTTDSVENPNQSNEQVFSITEEQAIRIHLLGMKATRLFGMAKAMIEDENAPEIIKIFIDSKLVILREAFQEIHKLNYQEYLI